jgi:hypothetical protein
MTTAVLRRFPMKSCVAGYDARQASYVELASKCHFEPPAVRHGYIFASLKAGYQTVFCLKVVVCFETPIDWPWP